MSGMDRFDSWLEGMREREEDAEIREADRLRREEDDFMRGKEAAWLREAAEDYDKAQGRDRNERQEQN
jgi:hypothetical protein